MRIAQATWNNHSLTWDVHDTHTREKVISNCKFIQKAKDLLDRMGYILVN
jgi:hypothetical protein